MMLPAPIKDAESSSTLPDQTCQRFSLAEIQSATRNFDKNLVIGRGGFGKVYKCPMIWSVSEVAVKRLHSMSNQGASEFEVEVQVLSKLRHGNLVSLIGYCNEGNEMALVYEFMPNGTLEDHLHKLDSSLSWLQRLKICIGAARGLDYLHTGTSSQHGVIHRDVKSSNILLDANFDAKISDFGLAKVGLLDQNHMSTAVKGTFGYMDPCYFYTGKLTRKSDVYAFGVVLFEVLSGRKAVDSTLDEEQWGLAGWAQHKIKVGKLDQIIDPRLIEQISKKCLKEFASIAGRCIHTQPKQRPTMAEVVFKIESILSQERESANFVLDEERFVYKLRYLFTGKVGSAIGRKCNFRNFTYAKLVSATNDFKYKEYSPTLNEYIYKGWVDERTYAPKEYGVGLAIYVRKMEFLAGKWNIKFKNFNHRNLVRLLGYCWSDYKVFCVYEVISGLTLDKHLYGEPGRTSLSWVVRLRIAIGAAGGLYYFHKRNKPAYSQFQTNFILVDTDFNARLSDFALDPHIIKLNTRYVAPEWSRYKLDTINGPFPWKLRQDGFAVKSEIYAFGVVLLEILTGMEVYDDKRPPGKENLKKWAIPLLADEINLGMIVDPQLKHNNCPPKGAFTLAQLISICLQPKQDKRPSMEEILKVLHHCYQEEINTV